MMGEDLAARAKLNQGLAPMEEDLMEEDLMEEESEPEEDGLLLMLGKKKKKQLGG
ncbi:MAG: hypothetical protein ACREVA_12995 [Burkholderiales bacterium]